LFAVLILTIGKRLFVRLGEQVEREGKMSNGVFVFSMLFLLAGAYITDAVGIYAVFGAFLIGAAMPRGKFADIMREKLEYVTVGVLLPFFFVYSGLNTKLSLLNSPALWGLAILILLAAIVGKGVACAVAARLSGEPWRESAAIGTLMNSRGLMELIILNIGLQQKVITETLFTMMMLMAIVTTLMTAPIFKWIYGKRLAEMKSNLVPV
jgi:Kef-type K+ transport system membrane component KefB